MLAVLAGDDPRAMRQAFAALGRLDDPSVVPILLAHAQTETRPAHLRTYLETLGKCGDAPTLKWIETLSPPPDSELERIWQRARLMLRRTLARRVPASARPPLQTALNPPQTVVFLCRRGLEPLVASSCAPLSTNTVTTSPGRVELRYHGPLASLFAVRSAIEFAVALPLASPDQPQTRRRGTKHEQNPGLLAEAVVAAIASAQWLTREGPVSLRVCFDKSASSGRRRAELWELAAAVDQIPGITNDPTRCLWEARIDPRPDHRCVLLVPRGFDDPRFHYRTADVPAASHPTLAAALAQLAVDHAATGTVWDPFVGSALELCEVGLRSPGVRLFGSDIQPSAITAAGQNLEGAALLSRTELQTADACSITPQNVSTIITNPPMGRRVQRGDVGPLLDQFLVHADRVLSSRGKLWWISPLPQRTRARAHSLGWRLLASHTVDMGGFHGEIQGFECGAR